jgi:hypothetical protein
MSTILLPLTPFIGPLYPMLVIHNWCHSKCEPDTATKVEMVGIVGQYVPTALMAVRKVWESWKGVGL